jgi:hypothetical protein
MAGVRHERPYSIPSHFEGTVVDPDAHAEMWSLSEYS